MITDALLKFCSDKALASAITTGKVIDLKQEYPNLGSLTPRFNLILQVKNAGGEGTVTFKLQDSADGSTFADLLTFTQVGSKIPANQAIPMPLKHRRYLKLITTVTGTVTGTLQRAVLDNGYELPRTTKTEGYDPAPTVD